MSRSTGEVVAWLEIPSQAVYAATKAALHRFSRGIRPMLEAHGVEVFEVMTPMVDTDMTTSLELDKMSPEQLAARVCEQVERGTRQIHPNLDAKLASVAHRWAPSWLNAVVRSRIQYRE